MNAITQVASSPSPTRASLPPVASIQQALEHAEKGAISLGGQPGAGKTTSLRQIAWTNAQQLLQGATLRDIRIPVYVDLAGRAARSQAVSSFIMAWVTSVQVSENSSQAIAGYLASRITTAHAVVLVDGLDEVSADTLTDVLTHISA